ncbi:dynamin family protein [Leifsonia sp. Leaf264]|uniref:dynamin family protein n=1 Tax=Leifsonia sp. Leaf264 TaxID=1736314 RepID=UPI0007008B34|nr:dynamin family protein [Leifsonia sp. Leaf264]KQO98489.1 hypothetical protein ASF30_10530 [Leifsonia sp. Leaf264]
MTSLTSAVLAVCDRFDQVGGPEVLPATTYARARLKEPLRVAVVGDVKAGKSTLINAVVGRKIAATADVECTKVVTQYKFGADEGCMLHLAGGNRMPVLLVNRMLPDRLPVPVDQISHAVVTLSSDLLREFTLIDTPGLSTTTAELEVASRQYVLGASGVRQADAIIYVFRGDQKADDVAFLKEFQRVAGDSSTASAIGVLSHADGYGKGPWGKEYDPIVRAGERAAEIEKDRASELSAVLPVAGLMAEASVIGQLREADARTLNLLAGLSELDLRTGQLPQGVSGEDVPRLARMVGEYTIRHGRGPAAGGTAGLTDWMQSRSGIDAVRALIRRRYIGRHPQLKAKEAMEQLERAAHHYKQRMPLRRMLSDAKLSPALHPLEEVRAWEALVSRHHDHELLSVADRLLRSGTDTERVGLPTGSGKADIARRAAEEASAARQFGAGGDPALARAAATISLSFTMVADRNR